MYQVLFSEARYENLSAARKSAVKVATRPCLLPFFPSHCLLDQILLSFVWLVVEGLWGVVEKCHSLLLRDCADPATLKVECGVLGQC